MRSRTGPDHHVPSKLRLPLRRAANQTARDAARRARIALPGMGPTRPHRAR